MIALLVVYEAPEAHQRLLHLLVSVEPFLLAWPDVCNPAICKFFGGVVQAQIFAIGERVVIDGRFDEVARDVAFMITAMIRRPALWPVLAVSQNISGLQVAIRHLSGEDDRNPALEGCAHHILRL